MAIYYVDDATGLDTDDGLSEANAWKTLAKAAASTVDNDLVNVKNTNDYIVTAPVSWTKQLLVRGYTTTPGDSGKFKCKTSTDSIGLFAISSNGVSLQNFHLKHEASTRGLGIYAPTNDRGGLSLKNFKIEGCTRGLDSDFVTHFDFYGARLENGEFRDCTVYGIIARMTFNLNDIIFRGCATGFRYLVGNNSCGHFFNRVIFDSNTNYGLHLVGGNIFNGINLDSCIFYNNGNHGIYFNGSVASLLMRNSIFYGNGGKGLEAEAALRASFSNCAFGANTGGKYNTIYFLSDYITNELTLTADPFIDAAFDDFNLNTVTGGGELLSAVNYELAG